MSEIQYDSLLGGDQHLPSNINIMQFTTARWKEIQAMRQSLSATSKGGKLVFQKLPKHMRRRVMSHNAKRLPRRLREIHLNQMKKSGLPPKQKRPSRKHRRRPKNLMDDYIRRQRRCKWLETHIWHAKRFHMIEKWGYKLAESPCDKAFRACYRATAHHCLLQDISYITCLELCGDQHYIIDKFKDICDTTTGLSIGAKAFLRGNREGELTIFKYKEIPKKAIGAVSFQWKPTCDITNNHVLWVWVHTAYYSEVLQILIELFKLDKQNEIDNMECYENKETLITLNDLRYELNRFRLTGPLSQAVLQSTLKPIDFNVNYNSVWLENYIHENKNIIESQIEYWKSIKNMTSCAQLSPHIIFSLIAIDPRFNFPKQRSKALPENVHTDSNVVYEVPTSVAMSPIWTKEIRKQVKESKVSNAKICEMRSELLVPGTDLEHPGVPVPYTLIQRPGNREEKLSYCSGWDVIIPSGWAQATWITLIMWGARVGGLRETDSMTFELGKPSFLEPDTDAGKLEDERHTELCKSKYFRLPPNKRTNFNKFSIVSPFKCNWNILVRDWANHSQNVNNFFVLRNKKMLQDIQEVLSKKHTNITNINVDFNLNCIVPVRLKLDNKGKPKEYAIICLLKSTDLKANIKEPLKCDDNQDKRKEMRSKHKTLLKQLRRRRINAKRNGKIIPVDATMLAQYRDQMRELWLPEQVKNIRKSCSQEVIGFVTKGDFSFTVAHSAAVGYIALGAVPTMLAQNVKNKVLVRNTSSRQYRTATLEIVI